MPQPHNITITDNFENWLRWGNLVMEWVNGTKTPPTDVGGLRAQMTAAHVNGQIQGPPDRGVTFVMYPTNGAVVIPLPNAAMVQNDNDLLRQLTNNGTRPAPYPLQSFYSVCFGGAAPSTFTLQELLDMEARRIGEYVINECM